MIYQHKYFQIDTEAKRIFDENGKELSLTGNAYRMLVFLCANKNATLTQIGEFLDWAKEYTENHLRQYRYKINTIIGNPIIEYKNGTYSIAGEIKEGLEINKKNRNTDLLQSNGIGFNWNNNISIKTMKSIKIAVAIVCGIFIFLGILFFLGRLSGNSPAVKKSNTGICHQKGTDYYANTKSFTAYDSVGECLNNGGRLPKK